MWRALAASRVRSRGFPWPDRLTSGFASLLTSGGYGEAFPFRRGRSKETPNRRGSRRGRSKRQEAFPVSTEKERRVCQVQSRARSTRHGRPNRALPSGINLPLQQASDRGKEKKKAVAIASATSEGTAYVCVSIHPSVHPQLAAHLGRRGLDVSCCAALLVWWCVVRRYATRQATPDPYVGFYWGTAVW